MLAIGTLLLNSSVEVESGGPPPKAKAAVADDDPAIILLAVFKLPCADQFVPLYNSVAAVTGGAAKAGVAAGQLAAKQTAVLLAKEAAKGLGSTATKQQVTSQLKKQGTKKIMGKRAAQVGAVEGIGFGGADVIMQDTEIGAKEGEIAGIDRASKNIAYVNEYT